MFLRDNYAAGDLGKTQDRARLKSLVEQAIAAGGLDGGTDIEDSGFANLATVASRLDPDGKSLLPIANVLSKANDFLTHIPWQEGNLSTGHRIARTINALPTAQWRRLNEGVAATRGQVAQYDEACGMLEDESKIDCRLADLNGGSAYLDSEEGIKLEGFAQQLATAVFYESLLTNPERIHGLTVRYPATTGYTASSYVLAGTNSGSDAQSVWLITWEPRKIYGIYPKGSMAGLRREYMGKERVMSDATSLNAFYAYVTRYYWDVGIAVEDFRYAVRTQWDPGDAEMGATEKGLYLKLQDARGTIFKVTPHTRWYMNRTSFNRVNSQLLANEGQPMQFLASGGKTFGDASQQGGAHIPHLWGIPVCVTDALVPETAIS